MAAVASVGSVSLSHSLFYYQVILVPGINFLLFNQTQIQVNSYLLALKAKIPVLCYFRLLTGLTIDMIHRLYN